MKRFQMAGGHLPPGLTVRAGCKALGRALRHRSCARGSQRSLDGAESSPYYLSGNSGSITQHPPRCSSALKNNPAWSSVSPQVPVFLGFHLERQHLESIIQSLISSRFSPQLFMPHAGSWHSVVQAASLHHFSCSSINFSYTRSLGLLGAQIQRCVLAGKSQNETQFSWFSYPRLAPASSNPSNPPEFLKSAFFFFPPPTWRVWKEKNSGKKKKPWKEDKDFFFPL